MQSMVCNSPAASCPPSCGVFRLSHVVERRNDRLGIRVIGGILGNMTENDVPLGVDDEHSRKLPDIADGHTDRVALSHGCNSLQSDGWREEFQGGCHLKAKGLIQSAVGIGDQREGESGLSREGRRFFRSTHTHQNHPDAGLLDLGEFEAQLRHLLSAECSPQMPQEHKDQRLIVPQLAEKPFGTVRKGHPAVDCPFIARVHGCRLPCNAP